MDNGESELLANLAKARRERFKQIILSVYKKNTLSRYIPPKLDFIIQNKTHFEMQYITNIYAIINSFIEYICRDGYMDTDISILFKTLINKIDELITSENYKYGIFGSNAWYNLFKNIEPLLSDYELSAINKYNTKDYIFIIKDTKDKEDLEFITINILKEITDILNTYVQKALLETKTDEKFSFFRGKQLYIGLTPNSNSKTLLNNATIFSITLFISNPDEEILESEIIVNEIFRRKSDYINFKQEYNALISNVRKRKRNKDYKYQLPNKEFQLSSYIGKYRGRRITESEISEVSSSKRKQSDEYIKFFDRDALNAGRAARAAKRTEKQELLSSIKKPKNGGNKKNKNGGAILNTDSFLKFKLFTFSFNFIENPISDNEKLLFDNFHTLLANEEDEENEKYFGLEGLYILNKIMENRIFIPREKYNPYKIRNYIFEKFITSSF